MFEVLLGALAAMAGLGYPWLGSLHVVSFRYHPASLSLVTPVYPELPPYASRSGLLAAVAFPSLARKTRFVRFARHGMNEVRTSVEQRAGFDIYDVPYACDLAEGSC